MARTTVIWCVACALTQLAANAFAQAPKEIVIPDADIIRLQPGETRTFQFDSNIRSVITPVENIVEVIPQSDRVFSFRGASVGETIVTARREDGGVVYRMKVVVGGQIVKLYGVDDVPYVARICDEVSCGPPIADQAKPESSSATVRKPTRSGGFIETQKNYK